MRKYLLPSYEIPHHGRLVISSILYVILGAVLSLIFFPQYSAFALLFFVTLGLTPLLHRVLQKHDFDAEHNVDLRKTLLSLFSHYVYAFIGIFIGYLLVIFVASTDFASLFFSQELGSFSFLHPTQTYPDFWSLFIPQLWLLCLCIALSFVYGTGAVLLMSAAASVLAFTVAQSFSVTGGVGVLLFVIFQVAAYIFAGFASSLIGVAFTKYNFRTKKAQLLIHEAAFLLIISLGLIMLSSFVEMIVVPLI